jgi:hypothetical protein
MASKRVVIGQTGSVVLSDEAIQYKIDKKRTVRYRYVWMKPIGLWRAEVIGPFHSALYGTQGIGTKKAHAKRALVMRLGNRFGYIGHLMFSDHDEADTIGQHDSRTLEDRQASPISMAEAIGSAGQ